MTRDRLRPRLVCAALLPAVLCVPPPATAVGFSSTTKNVDKTHLVRHMADCGTFKLKQVTDDTAARTRTYWFDGICRIWVDHMQGGLQTSKTDDRSLWAEARVTWHAGSSRLDELVQLADPQKKHSGSLRSGFKCMGDPVAHNAQCVRLEFKNLTDWSGFSVPADKDRPLLKQATTGAQVNQLAATKKLTSMSGQPAPPRAQPNDASQGNLGKPPPAAAVATTPNGAGATDQGGRRLSSPPAADAPLPDLASGARVVVAGRHSAASGGMLALSAGDVRAAANGVCQVAFEHEIRNLGAADSPPSQRRWTIDGNLDALVAPTPAIVAGATVSRVDTIGLRTGANKLRLRLDPLDQLKEASEANNEITLTVSVAGPCGGVPPPAATAAATDNLRFSPAHDGTAAPAQGRLRMPSATR
ncbi:MAG: hypothetical protein KA766_14160 [Piscinibacter sp.]|uniref:CARDB domain-containing protein n=1 Tax=Piscinibacter sp. TaxID=1903157 RepID=UPI0011D5420A|nr:CARDB domain-containing protein [Piscinibacter sp.]MBP5991145.1 hypothetical protein [Piscinibacter sp.]MBP6028357.1 hypothetical protein [Piscinibacter sp.]TXH58537.1 MAG: hypothetical protein E6Q93_10480 [Burkholderiaceae bacterium]